MIKRSTGTSRNKTSVLTSLLGLLTSTTATCEKSWRVSSAKTPKTAWAPRKPCVTPYLKSPKCRCGTSTRSCWGTTSPSSSARSDAAWTSSKGGCCCTWLRGCCRSGGTRSWRICLRRWILMGMASCSWMSCRNLLRGSWVEMTKRSLKIWSQCSQHSLTQ